MTMNPMGQYGDALGLPPPDYGPLMGDVGNQAANALGASYDSSEEDGLAQRAQSLGREADNARESGGGGNVAYAHQLEDMARQYVQKASAKRQQKQQEQSQLAAQQAADFERRSSPEGLDTAAAVGQSEQQSTGVMANPYRQAMTATPAPQQSPMIPGTLPDDLRNHPDPQIRAFVRGESNTIIGSSFDNSGGQGAQRPEVLEARQRAADQDFSRRRQVDTYNKQVEGIQKEHETLTRQRAALPPAREIDTMRQRLKRDQGLGVAPDKQSLAMAKVVEAADKIDEALKYNDETFGRTRRESADYQKLPQGETPEQAGRTAQENLDYRDKMRAEEQERYQHYEERQGRQEEDQANARDVNQARRNAQDLSGLIKQKEKSLRKYDPSTAEGKSYMKALGAKAPKVPNDKGEPVDPSQTEKDAWATDQMQAEGEKARQKSEVDDAYSHFASNKERLEVLTSNDGLSAIRQIQKARPNLTRSQIVDLIVKDRLSKKTKFEKAIKAPRRGPGRPYE